MTECNRCGNCCDPVFLDGDLLKRAHEWGAWYEANPDAPHKKSDNWRLDSLFIYKHWTLREQMPDGTRITCDQFDTETRLCTAHDDRPPVCSGYPWYGKPVTLDSAKGQIGKQCSFQADLVPIILGPNPKKYLAGAVTYNGMV